MVCERKRRDLRICLGLEKGEVEMNGRERQRGWPARWLKAMSGTLPRCDHFTGSLRSLVQCSLITKHLTWVESCVNRWSQVVAVQMGSLMLPGWKPRNTRMWTTGASETVGRAKLKQRQNFLSCAKFATRSIVGGWFGYFSYAATAGSYNPPPEICSTNSFSPATRVLDGGPLLYNFTAFITLGT